jgi:YD repeat-containing protein
MVAIVTGLGFGLQNGSGSVLGSRGQLGDATFGRYGENVTVNAATGNLLINRTDEILIGLGPDDTISRSYNSLGAMSDDNGDNWQLNAQRAVTGLTGTVNTVGSTITRTDWDGAQTVFTWDASRTAYVSKSGGGAYDQLTYASNVWTWTDGSTRTVETYDNLNGGRITSSKDTDNNSLTYGYTSGLLTSVTTANGDFTTLTWSGNNLTSVVTSYTRVGNEATYASQLYRLYDAAYNRAPNVISEYDVKINAMLGGTSLDSVATTFYNSSEYQAFGVGSMTNDAYVDFLYQSVLRRTATTTEHNDNVALLTGGTTRAALLKTFSESTEHVTLVGTIAGRTPPARSQMTRVSYTYDTANRLSTVTTDLTPIDNAVQDSKIVRTTYTYDGTSKRVASISQTGGASLAIGYVLVGTDYRIASYTQTLASGLTATTNFSYDVANGVTTITDAQGQATKLSYDGNGQLTRIELPPAQAGAATQSISYSYNSNGDVLSATDANGNTTSYAYDSQGNLTLQRDAAGNVISRTYGSKNELLTETRYWTPDPDGAGTGQPSQPQTTRYVYTSTNHLKWIVSAAGDVLQFAYDGYGQQTGARVYRDAMYDLRALSPATPLTDAMVSAWSLDLSDPSTSELVNATYDFRGNIAIIYSASKLDVNGYGIYSWPNNTEHGYYIYDQFGNKLSYSEQGISNNPAFIYDGLGRVISSVDLNNGTTSTVFTDGSNQTVVTNAGGLVTTSTYNLAGQLISSTQAGSGVPSATATNRYDSLGNLRMVTDATGRTSYYLFDGDGRKVADIAADGAITEYVYDAGNRLVRTIAYATVLTSAQLASLVDGGGNPTNVTLASIRPSGNASDRWDWRIYDSADRLIETIDNNGAVTLFDHDGAGNLTRTTIFANRIAAATLAGYRTTPPTFSTAPVASDPTDSITRNFYDGDGRVTGTLDGAGYLSQTVYDGGGEKVETAAFANTTPVSLRAAGTFAQLLASVGTSSRDAHNRYFYDGLGILRYSLDANLRPTEYVYNSVQPAPATAPTHITEYGASISPPPTPPVSATLNGIFFGSDPAVLTAAETALGGPVDIVDTGPGRQNWSDWNLDYAINKMAGINRTKLWTIPLFAQGSNLADAAAHSYDNYYVQAATKLVAAYGSTNPILVRVGEEFNGNWEPWAAAGKEADFAQAYRNFVTAFRSVASNFKFEWNVANSATGVNLTTAYPGDAYVDYIGMDFYWDSQQSGSITDPVGAFNYQRDNAVGLTWLQNFATAHGKQTAFSEWGANSSNAGMYFQLVKKWFTDHPPVYASYWDSNAAFAGQMSNGQYGPASDTFKALFGHSGVTPPPTFTLAYVQQQVALLAGNTDNRTTRSVYDAGGRLAYSLDPTGAVTGFVYDTSGRMVKQTQYSTRYITGSDQSAAVMDAWIPSQAYVPNRVSRKVYDAADRLVYDVDPTGYITEYRYDAENRLTLKIQYAGVYTVSDGVTRASLAAQIGGTIPSTSVQTSYSYDADGRVSDSYDGMGVRTHIDYDALGRVTDRTLAYGTSDAVITHYGYDAAGRVASVTHVYGQAEATTTSYTYDGLGNVQIKTDGRGNTTGYTYDQMGRVLTETVQLDPSTYAVTTYTYDAFGNAITSTDARGNIAYSYYNLLGQQTLHIDPEGYATATSYTIGGEVATVTHYANRVTGTIIPATPPAITVDPARDAVTSFTYDKAGHLTKVTDAVGYYEQYTLNAFGDRITVRNKLGGTTTNAFDKRGLLTQETLPVGSTRADGTTETANVVNTYQYDARGNRIEMIEAAGLTVQRTTVYTYDKMDRLLQTIGDQVNVTGANMASLTAVSPTTTNSYDQRGNLISVSDPDGNLTLTYYDHLNRKIAQVSPVKTLSTWAYDANGNVTSTRIYGDPLASFPAAGGTAPAPVNSGNYRETTFTYDLNNRQKTSTITGITLSSYNGTSYTTAVSGVTSQNIYDGAGNIIQQIDASGNSIFSYYDKAGHKIAQVDQAQYLTSWTLDGEGNVLSETRYANAVAGTVSAATVPSVTADGVNDRTTIFIYDRNGRRTSEARPNVQATSATIYYTYNGLGEVLTKTEATGDATTYTYDAAGRQLTVTGPAFTDYNNNPNAQQVLTNAYDGLNNLARSVQNSIRVTSYSYGAGGRLASVTDATGFVTNYSYDAAGRMMGTRYIRVRSDGSSVTEAKTSAYDEAGRVTSQGTMVSPSAGVWNAAGDTRESYYNAYGDLIAWGTNTGGNIANAQEFADYDKAGRLWRSTAGDGTTKLFLYDAAGNATLTITPSGGALPSGYSWASFTIDQAIALLTNNGASPIGTVAVAGMVVTITAYDRRNQAVSVREPLRDLGGGVTTTIVHGKTYNAFGEVSSETDARNDTTTYTYNVIGKLTSKVMPQVSVTSENGAISTINPTEYYYYDLSGRLVGTRDANGNLTTRTLLAGSGYGGTDPLVLQEFHADGGVVTNSYDVFGDLRHAVNEIGKATDYVYDKMDRVTQVAHALRSDGTQLIDSYGYDGLGQRIKHWNNYLGVNVFDRTDYDLQGRVVSEIDMGLKATTYSYSWNAGLGTAGLGTSGGWTKTTVNVAGLSATDSTDYFGRTIGHSDFGGVTSSYGFDLAGHLTSRTNSLGEAASFSWFNTGQMAQAVDATYVPDKQADGSSINYSRSTSTSYRYDADGNRTYEESWVTISDPNLLADHGIYWGTLTTRNQNSVTTYDALNRMVGYSDGGENGGNPVTIAYEYDAAANVRHTAAQYRDVAFGGTLTQDYWYKYDNMNRFVTTRGTFNGSRGSGTITRGLAGTDIVYDAASRRVSAATTLVGSEYTDFFTIPTLQEQKEIYSYTNDGYLSGMSIALGAVSYDDTVTAASGSGTQRAVYTTDLMGRTTFYAEYLSDGTTLNYSRAATYNASSLVTDDVVQQHQSNGSMLTSTTHYDYALSSSGAMWQPGAGGAYQRVAFGTGGAYQGVLTHSKTTRSDGVVSENEIFYTWRDSALKLHSGAFPAATGGPNGHTDLEYDSGGNLTGVEFVSSGVSGRTDYVNIASGKALGSWHSINDNMSALVYNFHYYANDVQIGLVGSDGAPETDYATALDQRGTTPGNLFRSGSPVSYADFDQSYEPANPGNPGMANGSYTVNDGDTLSSIALAQWGDASLWYLIADANGLTGSANLAAGQVLTIPAKVTNLHNSASTFKVYDPNSAIGNTDPLQPPPPSAGKHGGCGGLGQILLVAIAVAVIAISQHYELFAALGPVLGGAAAGAAGSVISQGIGLATGIQDKFSFKGVALAAIAGGVTGGLNQLGHLADVGKIGGTFGKAAQFVNGSSFLSGVARGALSSTLTQGISVATGLQHKFDWVGVAAAGIGNGAGSQVKLGGIGGRLVSGMADAIANAATRSLITGTDFGDNIMAALPDVIGNTIGNLAASKIASIGGPRASSDPRLAYADVSGDDSVTYSGGTTGAGDGTRAQPVAGAGGGQLGRGATSSVGGASAQSSPSSEGNIGEIVVNGNRNNHWSDSQYNAYEDRVNAAFDASYAAGGDGPSSVEIAAIRQSVGSMGGQSDKSYIFRQDITLGKAFHIGAPQLSVGGSTTNGKVGQITATLIGKQIESFADAAIETGASAKDVKYIRGLGKGVAVLGDVIAFTDLRRKGFSVQASVAGAAVSNRVGNAIVLGGATAGTFIEPGLGTVIVGGGAWVADQVFDLSDAAGVKAAQQYDLRINGKKVGP